MAITKSYTFTNNTVADPAEVNQNFDDVLASIKAAHHRDADGTKISYQDIATGWGLVPSKGILMFNDLIANVPTGYYFCNGANGTPDLRNRFVLCAGQDSGGTYDVGDTGGEATHVLTTTEMPTHAHGVTDPSHAHTINPVAWGTGSGGTNRTYNSGSGGLIGTEPFSGSVNAAYTGISIQNAGSGGAHNNMPPFTALVFIMKS